MDTEIITIPPLRPFPNNALFSLVVYRSAIEPEQARPEWFEEQFSDNGWGSSWRNGVFSFHHFHSTAHEVLGCYAGSASVLFGGPKGKTTTLYKGDAIVIPAGVAHCLLRSSLGFHVVGAYPDGTWPDTMRGAESEYMSALQRSANVPLPETDPLAGKTGPLIGAWS